MIRNIVCATLLLAALTHAASYNFVSTSATQSFLSSFGGTFGVADDLFVAAAGTTTSLTIAAVDNIAIKSLLVSSILQTLTVDVSGSLSSSAGITINGGNTLLLRASGTLSGAITIGSGATLTLIGGTINDAVIEIQSGGRLIVQASDSAVNAARAQIKIAAGAYAQIANGIGSATSSTSIFIRGDATLTSSGSASATVYGAVVQGSGSVTANATGTYRLVASVFEAGTRLTVNAGARVELAGNSTSHTVFASGAAISNAGTVALVNGALLISGTFTVAGDLILTSAAAVRAASSGATLASTGTLSFSGAPSGENLLVTSTNNAAISASSSTVTGFRVQLGNAAPARVTVSGTATVSGTVTVVVDAAGSFAFGPGTRVVFLTYGTLSGSFSGAVVVSTSANTRSASTNTATVDCSQNNECAAVGQENRSSGSTPTPDALAIGLGVGLGVGIPVLILVIVIICCCCCRGNKRSAAAAAPAAGAVTTTTTKQTVSSRRSATYSDYGGGESGYGYGSGTGYDSY